MAEPRIRILPPALADQIAAGEVVERPASVVKELVENSLDAGARRIDVEVEGGGRRLIKVVDDGGGMSGDEARLALMRHATSKLSAVDDLFDLSTMGFRGEALPSIAAVSRFTMTTRTAASDAAFRLVVEGSVEREAAVAASAVGTQIEVRDLLWNVPARLKFMKAEATEAAHVTEAVARLALAHPAVHFKLRHGGRVALELPAVANPDARVRAVLGRALGARLVGHTHAEAGVGVRLWLGPPEEAQTTSRGLYLYVGRRFVRDRGLLHAVAMGFGELVPRGRTAVGVVFVDPPVGTVDVNVHPQKTEVRFARAQDVFAAVRHAVAAACARAPWLEEGPAASPAARSVIAVASAVPPLPLRLADVTERYGDAQERTLFGGGARGGLDAGTRSGFGGGARGGLGGDARGGFGGGALGAASGPPAPGPPIPFDVDPTTPLLAKASVTGEGPVASAAPAAPGGSVGAPPSSAMPRPSTASARPASQGFFAGLEYLGQLDLTYLVCEAPGELVLIDQHAAHERIAFQRLRDAFTAERVRTQRLLFPRPLTLGDAQAAAAAECAPTLAQLGYELDSLGGNRFALRTAPADLPEAETLPTLLELLTDLAETDQSRAVEERLEHMLATIACHAVVRAGDVLSPDEARALLEAMDGVDYRVHCPHGRPVLLRIGVAELARRFGRT
jgi:DNA mismatch repair protein MutL